MLLGKSDVDLVLRSASVRRITGVELPGRRVWVKNFDHLDPPKWQRIQRVFTGVLPPRHAPPRGLVAGEAGARAEADAIRRFAVHGARVPDVLLLEGAVLACRIWGRRLPRSCVGAASTRKAALAAAGQELARLAFPRSCAWTTDPAQSDLGRPARRVSRFRGTAVDGDVRRRGADARHSPSAHVHRAEGKCCRYRCAYREYRNASPRRMSGAALDRMARISRHFGAWLVRPLTAVSNSDLRSAALMLLAFAVSRNRPAGPALEQKRPGALRIWFRLAEPQALRDSG